MHLAGRQSSARKAGPHRYRSQLSSHHLSSYCPWFRSQSGPRRIRLRTFTASAEQLLQAATALYHLAYLRCYIYSCSQFCHCSTWLLLTLRWPPSRTAGFPGPSYDLVCMPIRDIDVPRAGNVSDYLPMCSTGSPSASRSDSGVVV